MTVENTNGKISAALRVGVACGISLDLPLKYDSFPVDAGIEAAVFANVAEFDVNVRRGSKKKECTVEVDHQYAFAVGAAAGASVDVDFPLISFSMGAAMKTSTPIYTTTPSLVCAKSLSTSAPAATTTQSILPRAGLTQTVVTTEVTQTATYCQTPGIGNCQRSMQVITQNTVTHSLATSVSSGWTGGYSDIAAIPKSFGEKPYLIPALSGSPTSYVAGTHESTDPVLPSDVAKGASKKLIVGVSVGVGVPVLLALVGGLMYVYSFQTCNNMY